MPWTLAARAYRASPVVQQVHQAAIEIDPDRRNGRGVHHAFISNRETLPNAGHTSKGVTSAWRAYRIDREVVEASPQLTPSRGGPRAGPYPR